MYKIKRIVALTLAVLQINTLSAPLDWALGVGLVDHHVKHYQIDEKGTKNLFKLWTFFEVLVSYPLDNEANWLLAGQGGLFWPGGNQHSYIAKNRYFINALLKWRYRQKIYLNAGIGPFFTQIQGDGGTTQLPNGGRLEEFIVPMGRAMSTNIVHVLGISYNPSKVISFNVHGFIFNIYNTSRRTISYTLSMNYNFGKII